MVERWPFKPMAVGSIPTEGVFCVCPPHEQTYQCQDSNRVGGLTSSPLNVSGGLAQSVECVVSNDEAPGSKPGFSTFSAMPP